MNKELAISILRGDVLGTNEQTHEAVFMAIKALEVEPVVRCKDCKYNKGEVNIKGYQICSAIDINITDDDYCSFGERMEDETN